MEVLFMNRKDPKLDSGSYVNGVYTSKNGLLEVD